ncbi:glycosyltransferase family 87 protein [Streptomyces sp. NPDC089799]|uniref:glycosyltransferase family 87 protein n=1 Tax=Streptomyces sp. NPDC089799 TaxID=3155066 RepID=UPI003440B7D4
MVGPDVAGKGHALLEWLLRPAARGWRALSLAVVLGVCVHASLKSNWGSDNAFVVKAADTLLAGGSPYEDKRFLYLPSAVLLAVPQALLPTGVLRWVLPVAVTALLAFGWWCALRLFGVPARSRFALVGFAALAIGFKPYENLVTLGNWTAVSAAALPAALLLAHRNRWLAAGAVVGLAIAAKPMLVPVGLLFLLARQWRGLAAAVLVPVALSLAGALLMPAPGLFFTKTLPFLLRGQDAYALVWDASPVAVLPRLGVPTALAAGLAGVLAAAGLWAAWRRWTRPEGPGGDAGAGGADGALRLAETACMVMLAAFLVSRPSFDHYLLVVLPLLLASVVRPGSGARSPWFWAALVPQVTGMPWNWYFDRERRAFKDCFTLCVLAVALMRACADRTRSTLGTVRTAGSAPPQRSAGELPEAGSRPAF